MRVILFLSLLLINAGLLAQVTPAVNQDVREKVIGKVGCPPMLQKKDNPNIAIKADPLKRQVLNYIVGKTMRSHAAAQLGNENIVRFRCDNAYDSNVRVLYVVDGRAVKSAADINTDDIENIEVLQGVKAFAVYGEEAKDGAIIITLKKKIKSAEITPAERVLVGCRFGGVQVKQADTPVLFKTRCGYVQEYRKGLLYVIDGEILKPGEEKVKDLDPAAIDSITVLNGAYAAALFGSDGMNGAVIITTKLKTKTLDSVVVTGTNCWKRQRISCCLLRVACSKHITALRTNVNTDRVLPKVYPNPVQRGNMINVSIPVTSSVNPVIMISDAAGRIVSRTVISNSIQKRTINIPVDKNWSTGIYHLRISGEEQQTASIPFLVQ